MDLCDIKVMGVLNVTPDSFFDGGKHNQLSGAIEQAKLMESAGASIIDIGGESTRPGAKEVSIDEELERVIPVIKMIRKESKVEISIDTSKPEVMQEAVKAGATIINDVRALQEPGALAMAASLCVPVCLMHMQGQPRTMQKNPVYENVVEDVLGFLNQRVDSCTMAGIERNNMWFDPGFGFGKSLEHNLSLLKHLERFVATDFPILVGMSRKSMLGQLLNKDVEERLPGSLALATIAAMKGAKIIRVHDVQETIDVVKVSQAVLQAQ